MKGDFPLASFFSIHHWPAFLTVVCLGLLQVSATYYSGTLAIESLPTQVSDAKRRRHKRVFAALFVTFATLTLVLGKLNDSVEDRAESSVRQATIKQEAEQVQLQRTLEAVLDSQQQLQNIKKAVETHPQSLERSNMLNAIAEIEQRLSPQIAAMKQTTGSDPR